jgi:hypothetical protein
MSNPLRTLLVGQHFHPPAKIVLACLTAGTAVRLEPDPQNPYDSEAIKVILAFDQIDRAGIAELRDREEELIGFGSSYETLTDGGPAAEMQLGHVAASTGKPLAKAKERLPNLGLVGTKELASRVPCPGRLMWVGEDICVEVGGESGKE